MSITIQDRAWQFSRRIFRIEALVCTGRRFQLGELRVLILGWIALGWQAGYRAGRKATNRKQS